MLGLLFSMVSHGLFDWFLMFSDRIGGLLGGFIYSVFIAADVWLWILGMKLVRKQQENSRLQAETAAQIVENETISTFN